MKGQSIYIDSSDTLQELVELERRADNNEEFMLFLDIYKNHGYETAKQASSNCPFTTEQLMNLVGKQVRLLNEWVDVLLCVPLAGSNKFVIMLSNEPDVAHHIDNTGYNSKLRIYYSRDKAKKGKKDKHPLAVPERAVAVMKSTSKPWDTQSNLMTESDFPLPEKRK